MCVLPIKYGLQSKKRGIYQVKNRNYNVVRMNPTKTSGKWNGGDKMKRLFAFVLAICMLTTAFAGCGQQANTPTEPKADQASTNEIGRAHV